MIDDHSIPSGGDGGLTGDFDSRLAHRVFEGIAVIDNFVAPRLDGQNAECAVVEDIDSLYCDNHTGFLEPVGVVALKYLNPIPNCPLKAKVDCGAFWTLNTPYRQILPIKSGVTARRLTRVELGL